MKSYDGCENVRMSVIIPVYNKSDYIDNCIHCLTEQTAPAGTFEAIFVDDGSKDDSLLKCLAAEEKHPFVRVIKQDNQGVSGARNTGIRNALGDYIMFLDADDSITPKSIEKLIESFDAFGDETDVVGYRMRYCYVETGKTSFHAREKWLPKTRLYYLENVPFIAQSTMNVCVRNRHENNILFNTELKMGEDQLFVSQNLERKATYGYCRGAQYNYTRDSGTASSRLNNPLYSFDDMITLFNMLVRIAEENPLMRRYAYSLILYNVGWRMKANMLFPNHLHGCEREEADQRLAAALGAIPHSSYAENPHLTGYHKAYLLERYVHPEQNACTHHAKENTLVVFENGDIWHTVVPTLVVERCGCYGRALTLNGRLIGPSFRFEGKPKLYLQENGRSREIDLGVSSYCYAAARFPVTRAWSFKCTIDFANTDKSMDLNFVVTIGGETVPKINFSFVPRVFNARVIDGKYYFPHLTLVANKNRIRIYPRNAKYSRKRYLKADFKRRAELAGRRKMLAMRARLKSKRFWMYVDLPTSEAEGNALAALLHDLNENDGVERYYVSNFEAEIVARYPVMSGRVVAANSDMHKYLSLKAEVVISSYLERFTFEPFGPKAYKDVGDLACRQLRVYVQHGILHAHMPWYFSYDRQMVDLEVISTASERRALTTKYGFSKRLLIDSGAPRLDRLTYSGCRNERKILYAPSWRSYLITGTAESRTPIDDTLLSSNFYQGLMDLVNRILQSRLLEQTDYTMELKLHPNFKCYEHLFSFESDRVKLAPDAIDERDYSILITDFSSYLYDFVYSGAKVLYFLPDHVEFDAGLNSYSELEIPFDKGFGPYCETPEQAFKALRAIIEGADANDDLYENRRKGFFLHTDGRNCERLYQEVKRRAEALQQ